MRNQPKVKHTFKVYSLHMHVKSGQTVLSLQLLVENLVRLCIFQGPLVEKRVTVA